MVNFNCMPSRTACKLGWASMVFALTILSLVIARNFQNTQQRLSCQRNMLQKNGVRAYPRPGKQTETFDPGCL